MAFRFPGDVPIESGVDDAQSHLTWLIDFRESMEMFQNFMALYLSVDNDIVLATPAEGISSLKVVAQGSPDMTVSITQGIALVDRIPFSLLAAENSATFAAPSGSTRIDLMVANPNGMSIDIVAGTEGAGEPATPANTLKLCTIEHPTTTTQIDNSDLASGDSFITDSRLFT